MMAIDYPQEMQRLPRGIVHWEEGVTSGSRKSRPRVWVECECGKRRLCDAYRCRRPDPKRATPSGQCHPCRTREHYATLNKKPPAETSRFKGMTRIDKRHGYVHEAVYPGNWLYESMGVMRRTGSVRYILQHRLRMAEHLGRPLKAWEHVHHKDRDKTNNAPDNLEMLDNPTHAVVTALERENDKLRRQLEAIQAARP